MSRPPLANLFAVSADDPSILDSVEADIAGSGEFAEVWRPAQGWLAASRLLPGSERDGDVVRDSGLAFAEGRDAVSVESRRDPRHVFREVATKTDRSPEHLARLPGDFGFARFRDGGSATVVRSCGDLVPFYLRCTGRCAAIATRLGDLVRYFPAESDLDPLVNAIWTTGHGFFPDGRTFLAGVSILARGHFARLERGRPAVFGRYWDPRTNSLRFPSDVLAREHAERLRALLMERLTRDLDPEGGNLLTLSGGVDSSSLAALASGTVGRRVCTLSPAGATRSVRPRDVIHPTTRRTFWLRATLDDQIERGHSGSASSCCPAGRFSRDPSGPVHFASNRPRGARPRPVWRRIRRRGPRIRLHDPGLGRIHSGLEACAVRSIVVQSALVAALGESSLPIGGAPAGAATSQRAASLCSR